MPNPNCSFFCLFHCFEGKEYQTESKWNETFGNVIFGTNVIQRTWSGRQAINEAAMRQGGAPSPLVGPSLLHQPTSSSYIYPCTPKTSREPTKNNFHRRNLLYLREPILEPLSVLRRRGNRPRRASTSSPSLLVCFRSKKDHREGFIPFGFRLIFLFCETLK